MTNPKKVPFVSEAVFPKVRVTLRVKNASRGV